MPACSWSLPSVGDTFSTLTCLSMTGSAPKLMSLARLSAESWVKLPEITAVPPNDVNAWSLGWMVGADCTSAVEHDRDLLVELRLRECVPLAAALVGEVHLDVQP